MTASDTVNVVTKDPNVERYGQSGKAFFPYEFLIPESALTTEVSGCAVVTANPCEEKTEPRPETSCQNGDRFFPP